MGRARRNPVPQTTLALTRAQMEQARGNKAIGFIRMHPRDFLTLTTGSLEGREHIIKTAATRLDYMKSMLSPRHPLHSIQPAFLKVIAATGQVQGHEGRHRMASLLKSAEVLSQRTGRKFEPYWWVGIILANPEGYSQYYTEPPYRHGEPHPRTRRVYFGARHIPSVFIGEFAPYRVPIKKYPFLPIRRD